jgi:hypothetical protein
MTAWRAERCHPTAGCTNRTIFVPDAESVMERDFETDPALPFNTSSGNVIFVIPHGLRQI